MSIIHWRSISTFWLLLLSFLCSRLHFVCILFKGKINTKRTILSTECMMLLFMKDSGVDLKNGRADTRIKVIAKYWFFHQHQNFAYLVTIWDVTSSVKHFHKGNLKLQQSSNCGLLINWKHGHLPMLQDFEYLQICLIAQFQSHKSTLTY